MAKNESQEFTIKNFCKYVFKKWWILAIALLIGGGLSVYSWKNQGAVFTSNMTLLVHDEVDTAGDTDEYAQIASILGSKEAYLAAGIEEEDIKIDLVTVSSEGKGIVNLVAKGESEEEIFESLEFVRDNSDKVLKSIFKENDFRTTVLKEKSAASVEGTKREKLLSVAIIMGCMCVVALGIDFYCFRAQAR